MCVPMSAIKGNNLFTYNEYVDKDQDAEGKKYRMQLCNYLSASGINKHQNVHCYDLCI